MFLGYQRRIIRVFGLSASTMIYFCAISVEDNLFVGYHRRRRLTFRLSASKMSYSQVMSVTKAFIKGLTKGFINGMVTEVCGSMGDTCVYGWFEVRLRCA